MPRRTDVASIAYSERRVTKCAGFCPHLHVELRVFPHGHAANAVFAIFPIIP